VAVVSLYCFKKGSWSPRLGRFLAATAGPVCCCLAQTRWRHSTGAAEIPSSFRIPANHNPHAPVAAPHQPSPRCACARVVARQYHAWGLRFAGWLHDWTYRDGMATAAALQALRKSAGKDLMWYAERTVPS
jgi:hypothetical protein